MVSKTVDELKIGKHVFPAFELEHDTIESQQVPWEFLYFIVWDIGDLAKSGKL